MPPEVKRLLDKYHGTLMLKVAKEHGIQQKTLDALVNNAVLDKDYPGVYVESGDFADPFYFRAVKFSRGIFSHETALYLHDMTDELIDRYIMSFPRGYHNANLSEYFIVPRIVNQRFYEFGVTKIETLNGNTVPVYDAERTLCDIWRKSYKADPSVKIKALNAYFERPDRDFNKLANYAQVLKVGNEFMTALEVKIG
ncbi:hypothetical protein MK904_04335 [Loigolactobacillus coryniformis]|uniref:Abortive phage infection protein n=1 Tax=Loigolactobacillus coryniformis subsp. coryniformis CECT 5711 TaxID=1185325 RepID=J3ERW0_9LACO|nr:hypothetical protein [Loigolactobacillus coryniformis]EJN56490.1 Hypothetical protein A11Y_117534 [Loigolactobacillus coryniformis subsp. coryniformis CECT 5711]MDC4185330.1 hypothetical protein [Loigolactobacillus coryniformis]MDN5954197.1 hypothetical protein [Loigolactobacillus coryniformis]